MLGNLISNACCICTKRNYYMKHLSKNVYYLLKNHHNEVLWTDIKRYSQVTNESDEIIKNAPHIPVMLNEVLQYLEPSPGKIYVDMTFGSGGHTSKILELSPEVKVFALDRDPVAHEFAQELSKKYPGQLIPLLGRFSELPELLCEYKVETNSIDGFLFDFGCSSMQFDVAERGFSLAKNGPLDMRMDGFRCPLEPTAAEVLQQISEKDLTDVLRIYGEEKQAKKIANAIINARYSFRSLKTTHELAQLIDSIILKKRHDKLGKYAHVATKTFQALRIFVNNELNEINYGIILAGSYLKTNGRLVTISFHSLEDTIVKRHITANISENVANRLPLKYINYGKSYDSFEMESFNKTPWKMLHKHVITPTPEEIDANPRSRSAKFRAIVKVD
nr:PREDICTED: probable methyltransferase-like protein 15 homolog [Megachile rotundata]XP_012153621.1 PREDICTED: probable methyltransferase-like protein 15 homolog [Megachile rotundata]